MNQNTPGLRLVDSHCHLDEVNDISAAVEVAKVAGLIGIVAVGLYSRSNERIIEIAANYAGFVFPAVGLHPDNLDGRDIDRELADLDEHLDGVCALGEVGLDYHKRVVAKTAKEKQQSVFREVLRLAVRHDKPVSVHSRYAWRDALTLVQESGIKKAVFHWFTGPSSVLKELIDSGYYISATPAAEYHQEHRRAVKTVPLERLLIETDAPVEYGINTRWPAAPADARRSLKAAAELWGIDERELSPITTANAITFFSIKFSPNQTGG